MPRSVQKDDWDAAVGRDGMIEMSRWGATGVSGCDGRAQLEYYSVTVGRDVTQYGRKRQGGLGEVCRRAGW